MHLYHVAASVLLSAPLFQGNLVQASGVCTTNNQVEANPVDLSIGFSTSCGMLPNAKAICWDTVASPSTGEELTNLGSPIKKVFVSDNGGDTNICAWVATGDIKCRAVASSSWTTIYTNAELVGVTGRYVCAARKELNGANEPTGKWVHRCKSVNNPGTTVLGTTSTVNAANPSASLDYLVRTYRAADMKSFYSNPSANHICKLMADDTVNCAGNNELGQVNPDHARIANPGWETSVAVNIIVPEAKSVAVGTTHTCVIKKDNNIWCWGEGFNPLAGDISLVQVHEGNGVPRAIVAGNGFTCYVSNNSLKCFANGVNPVPVAVTISLGSVFTAWAGVNQACVQVNVGGYLPAPGLTRCFNGVSSVMGGADQYNVAGQPNLFAVPLGCASSANCVTTDDDGANNYGLKLDHVPLDFGEYAIVEGADADSYFGLTYTFHPEQYLPPGVPSAMFAYIIPTNKYPTNVDAGNGCVLTPSDAPFSARVKKDCFQLTTDTTAAVDRYKAKVVLRTCMIATCGTYTEAGDIYGDATSMPYTEISMNPTAVFANANALNDLIMCPYLSVLDFDITVEIGNLVETTQSIDLNWARDDVTEADADDAESAVAINDDLANPVQWAICDRAVNTGAFDGGYNYQNCFAQVNKDGNSRVVQLSKEEAGTALNKLAMGFRLHEDDRRLVDAGYLTLIPEKTSFNLFHSAYTGLKTGRACQLADSSVSDPEKRCTHVKFSSGVYSYQLNTKAAEPGSYPWTADLAYSAPQASQATEGMQKYEVAFNGELPKFEPGMGCGVGGKFCTIVMELTFEMGSTTTTTRRLMKRQVHLPMRMLEGSEGTDITVALAQASPEDQAKYANESNDDSIITTAVPAAGSLLVVAVGVALFMRRRGKKEEEEALAKDHDVESIERI